MGNTETTHTHRFEDLSGETRFTVDYRNPNERFEPRFDCECGYFTTYSNGGKVTWHDATGKVIKPKTP